MMHHFGRVTRRLALGLALASGLAAQANAQDLVVAVKSGPLSMDPHFHSAGQHASAARNVFDALVRRGPNMELLPNLATEWRSVDATTWEFKLRPDVLWHDGTPFTAADVKFSIDRVPSVGGQSGGVRAYTKFISETVVVDAHTVRFITTSPAPSMVAELDRVFIVQARAAANSDNDTFRTGGAAIGTGPYRYVSWEPKGDLVLEANDRYWGEPKPAFRRVTFREISNDSARVAALLANNVDMINYVPPASMALLERNQNLAVVKTPSIYVFMLHPDGRPQSPLVTDNEGRPMAVNPLRDVRVRRAMSMALNRDAIARVVMEGMGTPAYQLMPTAFFGIEPNPPPLPFDIGAARRLMAEAGYPQGFRVQLHCTADRLPNDSKLCAALAPMLQQIGIRLEVNPLPTAVYLTSFTRGEYSLGMHGWGTLTGESTYMLSSLLYTRDGKPGLGTFNRARYSNPALDAITEKAMATMDQDERRRLLEQGMRMAIDDMALIPIVNISAVWALNARKLRYTARMDEETLAIDARPVN
jgi:peptide/nickel transport system substrate-binding protein